MGGETVLQFLASSEDDVIDRWAKGSFYFLLDTLSAIRPSKGRHSGTSCTGGAAYYAS